MKLAEYSDFTEAKVEVGMFKHRKKERKKGKELEIPGAFY